eukprot:scaffold1183_cov418-Prasinococcus_capsulatus_cf.AAC.3
MLWGVGGACRSTSRLSSVWSRKDIAAPVAHNRRSKPHRHVLPRTGRRYRSLVARSVGGSPRGSATTAFSMLDRQYMYAFPDRWDGGHTSILPNVPARSGALAASDGV